MTDSIIPTDDLGSAKELIADLRHQIEARRHECSEKVHRIRQRALADEQYEEQRASFEIEPLRRRMEATILCLADYESLKAPAPVIIPAVP